MKHILVLCILLAGCTQQKCDEHPAFYLQGTKADCEAVRPAEKPR